MSSPAEFLAKLAHRNHSHGVGIFFTKQHHRACLASICKWHRFPFHVRGFVDLNPDIFLDLNESIIVDRFLIRKIKSQAIRFDFAALLLRVFANVFVKRVVQNMSCGVGASQCDAAVIIDNSFALGAFF